MFQRRACSTHAVRTINTEYVGMTEIGKPSWLKTRSLSVRLGLPTPIKAGGSGTHPGMGMPDVK